MGDVIISDLSRPMLQPVRRKGRLQPLWPLYNICLFLTPVSIGQWWMHTAHQSLSRVEQWAELVRRAEGQLGLLI
jgi:hypothetical protein